MRLRTGVIGCGAIAQVMHLHYLRELRTQFSVDAVCDISPAARRFAVETYCPAARQYERWEDLLDEQLDAVLVLTPTNHAPVALAAVSRGFHVLVEKPAAYSPAEAVDVARAADEAGVQAMVGYMKRYDPAYVEARRRLAAGPPPTLVQVTTLESPWAPYVEQYPLCLGERDAPEDVLAASQAADCQRLEAAVGPLGGNPRLRRIYRWVLLDNLVHELNMLRGLLGEPTTLRSASIPQDAKTVTAVMAFGGVECVLAWADLPELVRYRMELAVYASDRRITLVFPSPYLRSTPTALIAEHSGDDGAASSSESTEVLSHEEPFKLELREFHRSVVDGTAPETGMRDAARDLALAQAILESSVTGKPVPHPTTAAHP